MTDKRWLPARAGIGAIMQAGLPKQPAPFSRAETAGLLLRGVVVATYLVDDDAHPQAENSPVSVYCDVLTYSGVRNSRNLFLPRCMVSQETGGMHTGRVWKPRAATIDVSGNELNVERGSNPAHMDGDHVLIGFVDNDFAQPIILRGIPHPAVDVGNEGREAGHRLNLRVADGDPDFRKHHGAFYGIDDSGNFTIDTTRAHAGALDSTGVEPEPAGDGSVGNVNLALPVGSKITAEIDGGVAFVVEGSDGDAVLTVGDGARSAVIFEALNTFWNSFLTAAYNVHTHVIPQFDYATAPGATLPPTQQASALSSDVQSNKLKIPNG